MVDEGAVATIARSAIGRLPPTAKSQKRACGPAKRGRSPSLITWVRQMAMYARPLPIPKRQARASRDEAEQLAEIKRLLQTTPAASGSAPIQLFGKIMPAGPYEISLLRYS